MIRYKSITHRYVEFSVLQIQMVYNRSVLAISPVVSNVIHCRGVMVLKSHGSVQTLDLQQMKRLAKHYICLHSSIISETI